MHTGSRARVLAPLGVADERRRAAIAADADLLFAEIGRWRRGCEPQWAPLGTPHLIGSCRMGRDPATSVTTPSGEVREADNLFLAGNSVIPTRLTVNPTLTAAALAVNTADAIAEAPVSAAPLRRDDETPDGQR